MTELYLDDASVLEGLTAASSVSWSGVLRVLSGREQIGAIVMREGRIAWAVCRYQREDLGTYLKRLGYVTAEQIAGIRRQYEALGKTKKLAALLEEAEIADRATLQSYLKQHVRRALVCLTSLAGCSISARGGEFKVEEEHTFALEELLGDGWDNEKNETDCKLPSILPRCGVLVPEALEELCELPGYKASLIGTVDGEVIASHNLDGEQNNASILSGIPAAWLKATLSITPDAGLGRLASAAAEGADGWLLARWIRPEFGVFIAVYLNKDGRFGAARHRLEKVATALEDSVHEALHPKRE